MLSSYSQRYAVCVRHLGSAMANRHSIGEIETYIPCKPCTSPVHPRVASEGSTMSTYDSQQSAGFKGSDSSAYRNSPKMADGVFSSLFRSVAKEDACLGVVCWILQGGIAVIRGHCGFKMESAAPGIQRSRVEQMEEGLRLLKITFTWPRIYSSA